VVVYASEPGASQENVIVRRHPNEIPDDVRGAIDAVAQHGIETLWVGSASSAREAISKIFCEGGVAEPRLAACNEGVGDGICQGVVEGRSASGRLDGT
jgi:hypothetical protein